MYRCSGFGQPLAREMKTINCGGVLLVVQKEDALLPDVCVFRLQRCLTDDPGTEMSGQPSDGYAWHHHVA